MAAAVEAGGGRALVRAWSRADAALSVGRFHRIDPAACGMQRRLSGGRIVPLGPGILGMTMVFPSSAWLAQGSGPLRPEQILNRALRPVLQVLRDLGVDAFYPGRDLVTVGGRTLLYCSFAVFADGVVLVEQLLAVESSFAALEGLADRCDPEGVAGADRTVFRDAVALGDCVRLVSRDTLLARLAEVMTGHFGCGVEQFAAMPADLAQVVRAEQSAYRDFLAERGPVRAGRASVAGISMLGAVEASARIEAGRLHEVEITGDLIAPFPTVEALQGACEGVCAGSEEVRATVRRVLLEPASFLLGANDLADLLVRLG
jgi:lipoate-protein ligase A